MLNTVSLSNAFRPAAALMIAVALTPVAAQPAPAESSPLSVAELEARLESLRLEIEREKETVARRAEQRAAEAGRLRKQREMLAERLLTAQLQHESNDSRLQQLESDAIDAEREAAQLAEQARSIAEAIAAGAERLRVHLSEIPGSDTARRRLREMAEAVHWSPEQKAANQPQEALAALIDQFDTLHRQAVTVSVRRANLHTAGGEREDVKLLCLGHVRFAYQTDQGRVGLALASPREASGYRWTENLGTDTARQIRAAIDRIQSGQSGLVTVPVDPTGRVQPETLRSAPDLLQRIRSGGLVMWPLAALALAAAILIAERVSVLYGRNGRGDRVADRVIAASRLGQLDRALQLCRQGRGAVSRVLESCLTRQALGQRAMEDSVQEQLLHELPRLNRFMSGIATLAAVAPLLGLLGTVTGIIRTFGVIRAFGNANPSLMAGGISEALMTTATGLVIAVPILITHSILRGRCERIVADSERHAAMLIMSLAYGGPDDPPARPPDVCGDAVSREASSPDVASSDTKQRSHAHPEGTAVG